MREKQNFIEQKVRKWELCYWCYTIQIRDYNTYRIYTRIMYFL